MVGRRVFTGGLLADRVQNLEHNLLVVDLPHVERADAAQPLLRPGALIGGSEGARREGDDLRSPAASHPP